MYIDVSTHGNVVIYMVNLLNYFKFKACGRSSSTCDWLLRGESSGQTVSYHGWCDSFPRVFPIINLSGKCLVLGISYPADGVTVFHMPPPSYNIRYSRKICVSVRPYVRMYVRTYVQY